jgi:hypothetical protein
MLNQGRSRIKVRWASRRAPNYYEMKTDEPCSFHERTTPDEKSLILLALRGNLGHGWTGERFSRHARSSGSYWLCRHRAAASATHPTTH